jgi:hypothetical protein
MAPEGGVVDTGNGQQAVLYGVIVNHYAPFEDTSWPPGSLEDATDDLVRQVIRSNSYLRAQDGQARREQGRRGIVLLGGAVRPRRAKGGHEERSSRGVASTPTPRPLVTP